MAKKLLNKTNTVYLTKDQVINHVIDCWNVSDKHWEEYEKPIWDKSWQLYENKMDFSDKKDWQSRAMWPKAEGVVDTTIAMIRRGLRGFIKDDWFTTDGIGDSDKINNKPMRVKKLASVFLDFISFINTYVSAIRTSLLDSIGILKVYPSNDIAIWDYDEHGSEYKPYKAWEPSVEETDPYDVRFSYDCRLKRGRLYGTYVVERIDIEYQDLLLEADTKGYEISDDVRPQDYPNSSEKQKMNRDHMEHREKRDVNISNPIEIKEWHGYVRIDPKYLDESKSGKGDKSEKKYEFNLSKKYVITTANDKALLRVSGQDGNPSYPNPNQEYVYHIIRPSQRKAREIYGKSLVKSIDTLCDMLNEIWQLNFDNAKITILKLFGIDVSKIHDLNSLELTPGNFIYTTDKVGEVIQELLKGSLPPESQWIPNAVSSEIDRHTGVTPSVEAGAPMAGVSTATEWQGLMQQSALKFEDLGKNIEMAGNVVLESVLDLILTMPLGEYGWMVSHILEEEPKQYLELFQLNTRFDIRITGISGMINKIQTQNKLLALLQILGPMSSVLGINIKPIVKGIIRANEDILVVPIEEILPDSLMLEENMIYQILMQIDKTGQLAFTFNQSLRMLQQQAQQQGKSVNDLMRSNAQPSNAGMTQTSASPLNWMAGGGPQG